jgi:hypothetical protein
MKASKNKIYKIIKKKWLSIFISRILGSIPDINRTIVLLIYLFLSMSLFTIIGVCALCIGHAIFPNFLAPEVIAPEVIAPEVMRVEVKLYPFELGCCIGIVLFAIVEHLLF